MAKKRRFNTRDFIWIAEYIADEFARRKRDRKFLDRLIKEIDRQVEMRPDVSHKQDASGKQDPRKAWLPEIELPLQAEALETLVADTDNEMFPDSGPWYAAHAHVTDEYLERADFSSFVSGDREEVASRINQDDADNLVRDVGNHWRRQYDFRGNISLINAEAFSYGLGLGRARLATKSVFMDSAKGVVRQDQQIPVLVPRSLKNTYVDDRQHILMQEGFSVGPLEIMWKRLALHDVVESAKRGSRNPSAPNGGWMPQALRELEADDKGMIELLEAEGDILVPRSRDNIFLPGVIFHVAIGKNATRVVRTQFRKLPFSSMLRFPYHKERMDTPYASSPLRKGYPLQATAVDALMRVAESAALNTQPPVGYDRNDMHFAQRGGPEISPGAQWGTMGDVKVHQIGRPNEMLSYYGIATQQYADGVGMPRARLGAQTVSHTTKFAKQAELSRGSVRTVRYIKSTLRSALTQWLGLEYEMGMGAMGRKSITMYSDNYRGFIEAERSQFPDMAMFEAHGAGGPAEEREKRELRMAALAQAMEVDQLQAQLGGESELDLSAIKRRMLEEGGWNDIEEFFLQPAGAAPEPMMEDEMGLGGLDAALDQIGPIPEPVL